MNTTLRSCIEQRVRNLRQRIIELGCDAALITNGADVMYLSNFTGSYGDASLLVDARDSKSYIISDARYTVQIAEECASYEHILHSAEDYKALSELITSLDIKKLGFENKTSSYRCWQSITDLCGASLSLIMLNSLCSDLRVVKDEVEITYIQEACDIACKALADTIPYIKAGVKESSVAAELEYNMRRLGASKPSFDTIVASGLRSAMPHGAASDKEIQSGDAVTIDFGAVYKGYCSDMTRTFFIEYAPPKLEQVYNVVYKAQEIAMNNIRSGLLGCEADAYAREYIAKNGYDKQFIHGLGHGVGIDIHEMPSLNRSGKMRLADNMVFSVEPGIYIEGTGGVRIEDLLITNGAGARILTDKFGRDITVL